MPSNILSMWLILKNKQMKFLRILFLSPFALLYRIIIEIRNKFYDWGILPSTEFDIPILSVGNLTVGGTGKTPHIEYLIHLLSQKEYKIAVLSRGYKRKSKGFYAAQEQSNAESLGDELFQMYRKFPQVGFFACADRVEGVQKILTQKEKYEVILLDDAYQHRSIKPGLSILLNDFNHPFYEDKIMPQGHLRETPINRKRAHIIITSKCPEKLKPIEQRIIQTNLQFYPSQSIYFSTVKYKNIYPIFKKNRKIENFSSFLQFYQNIFLITGIAENTPLLQTLESENKKVKATAFSDHHNYSEEDLEKIIKEYEKIEGSKIILTTEKDAVRFLKFKDKKFKYKDDFYYVSIKINFLKEQKYFNQQIIKYVESNKRKR